ADDRSGSQGGPQVTPREHPTTRRPEGGVSASLAMRRKGFRMYPDHTPQRAVKVHQPTPIPPPVIHSAPVVPAQPGTVPTVASIVLPDGRVVTGYAKIGRAH